MQFAEVCQNNKFAGQWKVADNAVLCSPSYYSDSIVHQVSRPTWFQLLKTFWACMALLKCSSTQKFVYTEGRQISLQQNGLGPWLSQTKNIEWLRLINKSTYSYPPPPPKYWHTGTCIGSVHLIRNCESVDVSQKVLSYFLVASKRVPGALVSSAALVVLSFCTFYFGISHSGLVDAVIQVGYTICKLIHLWYTISFD